MLKQTIFYLAFSILTITGLQNAVADAVVGHAKIKTLGYSEACIEEPVFNGKACIYEANKKADKTIVLVHGINGEATNWYYQLKELKKKYHVLTFDLPGFGKSEAGNKLYSPTNYAKFVHYVTRKYVGGRFYLMGHSMGGAITLRYTYLYPDDVERLILVDVGGILHRLAYTESLAFKWLGVFQKMTYLSDIGLQDFAASLLETLEWLPIDLRKALADPIMRKLILKGNSSPIAGAALVDENFTQAIYSITTPTLIVWGAYDMIAPLRTGKVLRARLQNAYMKILPRAAHSSMSDQPAEFNRLMLSHLQSPIAQIEKRYWHMPQFVASNRVGRCLRNDTLLFEGAYKRIEVDACKKVIIRNASVGQIVITDSRLEIEDTVIHSKGIGINLADSHLKLTSSDIKANVAIQVARSKLDVAGVELVGHKAALISRAPSSVIFSVSHAGKTVLHSYMELPTGKQIK